MARLAQVRSVLNDGAGYQLPPLQEPPLPVPEHERVMAPPAPFVIVKKLPDFDAATIV